MVSKFKLDNSKSSMATQQAIARSMEMANQYAGELTIEVLPLDRVELDPENSRDLILTLQDALHGIDSSDPDFDRKKQEWKSLETLAKTIRDNQLINPIFVYRYGNKCRLIAGERRTLASAIAGKKDIIARIANQRPVGTDLKVLQWIENNERSDLSLAERVASLEAILQAYFEKNNTPVDYFNVTAQTFANLTGISETQARRYLLILRSNASIKEAVMSGKLENIKVIEFLCSVEKSKDQLELLNIAISGSSLDELIRLKKVLDFSPVKQETLKVGRKKTHVKLKIKPLVAKHLFEAMLFSSALSANVVDKINAIRLDIQWANPDEIENAFKTILDLIGQEDERAYE